MSKRLFQALLAATLFLTPALPSFAGTQTHEEAGVQFFVPDDWKEDVDGDMLIISPKDDSIMLMFWVVDSGDLDSALEAATGEFDKIMQDVEYTHEDPQETKIGAFTVHYVDGSATIEGQPVTWEMSVLMGKKPMIVMSIAHEGALDKHMSAVEKIIMSLKKV
jgi:hypothetical protein